METKGLVVRVIEKEIDHVEGSPLMRYTFMVERDQTKLGRYGETITKYYAIDPNYPVNTVCTL